MVILFIDDDVEDYHVFCQALNTVEPGAKCLHVTDGQQGLDVLYNILPDYIFVDINMPVMGGEECLINIKKNPSLKRVPVFVYSTTRHAKEVETFKKLGANDFVIKPTSFQELVDTLKVIIVWKILTLFKLCEPLRHSRHIVIHSLKKKCKMCKNDGKKCKNGGTMIDYVCW